MPEGFSKDILRSEVYKATKVLGVLPDKVKVLNYRVRRFGEVRQDILEDMIIVRSQLDPDLVLLPSLSDCHQDHSVIANEGT